MRARLAGNAFSGFVVNPGLTSLFIAVRDWSYMDSDFDIDEEAFWEAAGYPAPEGGASGSGGHPLDAISLSESGDDDLQGEGDSREGDFDEDEQGAA